MCIHIDIPIYLQSSSKSKRKKNIYSNEVHLLLLYVDILAVKSFIPTKI